MYSALVLAAGLSDRMGQPKNLLPFGNETCLSLVLKACRGAGVGEIVLVVGKHENEVRRGVDLTGVELYRNLRQERGQTASLKIGLSNMSKDADAFFIFPADFPLVRSSILKGLIQAYEEKPTGKTIFVPSFGNRRGHPILVDKVLRPTLKALQDSEPAHNVIRANEAKIHHMKVRDPAVIIDVDTPDDYKRCLDIYLARQKPPPISPR